jgi:hypothetical protein
MPARGPALGFISGADPLQARSSGSHRATPCLCQVALPGAILHVVDADVNPAFGKIQPPVGGSVSIFFLQQKIEPW